MNTSRWQAAQWLGVPFAMEASNPNQFRGVYPVPSGAGQIQTAYLLITGLGVYEAYVNGQMVSSPGSFWSQTVQYDHRIYYDMHNITPLLSGSNITLAVELGNGWYGMNNSYFYNPPFAVPVGERTFRCLLVLVTQSQTYVLGSNAQNFKQSPGVVVSDNYFDGEAHDGRRATPGWEQPGFDGSGWAPATVISTPPAGAAKAVHGRIFPVIDADSQGWPVVSVSQPQADVYVFKLEKNNAGKLSKSVIIGIQLSGQLSAYRAACVTVCFIIIIIFLATLQLLHGAQAGASFRWDQRQPM